MEVFQLLGGSPESILLRLSDDELRLCESQVRRQLSGLALRLSEMHRLSPTAEGSEGVTLIGADHLADSQGSAARAQWVPRRPVHSWSHSGSSGRYGCRREGAERSIWVAEGALRNPECLEIQRGLGPDAHLVVTKRLGDPGTVVEGCASERDAL